MSKCGVIMKDPRNGKPKIKLYRTEDGDLKGDGTCCYIKMESVELALQILDGWELNKHKVQVERAKFELKGEFDPSKKKRKLTATQKKRFFESQQKFDFKLNFKLKKKKKKFILEYLNGSQKSQETIVRFRTVLLC